MQALWSGFVHDFQCFTGLKGANDTRTAVALPGQMFEREPLFLGLKPVETLGELLLSLRDKIILANLN